MIPTGNVIFEYFNCFFISTDFTNNIKKLRIFSEVWTNDYGTGWERLIRNHSSARFCFELSRNSN